MVVLSTEAVVQGAKGAVAAEAPRPVHWVCINTIVKKGRDWNANDWSRFGLVATALEMIPLASIFFTYTNTGRFYLVYIWQEAGSSANCWNL